jgi:uncharacterized protein YkwD
MRRLASVAALLAATALAGGCSAVADVMGGDDAAPVRRAPVEVPPDPGAAEPRTSLAAPPEGVPDEDRRMFEEANRLRAAAGLRPFRWSEALHRAACEHSEEQRRHGYMGHGSPDPRRDDLADRLRLAGYGAARQWGEIVAMGYDGPKSVMTGWMNSRGHRKILMDGGLTEAGFSRMGSYFTGNFATPRGP